MPLLLLLHNASPFTYNDSDNLETKHKLILQEREDLILPSPQFQASVMIDSHPDKNYDLELEYKQVMRKRKEVILPSTKMKNKDFKFLEEYDYSIEEIIQEGKKNIIAFSEHKNKENNDDNPNERTYEELVKERKIGILPCHKIQTSKIMGLSDDDYLFYERTYEEIYQERKKIISPVSKPIKEQTSKDLSKVPTYEELVKERKIDILPRPKNNISEIIDIKKIFKVDKMNSLELDINKPTKVPTNDSKITSDSVQESMKQRIQINGVEYYIFNSSKN